MEDHSEKRRVLVVDDEKNIRLTLRQVLQEEGLHVETATDGGAALDVLRAEPGFDLVLLDLRMPGTGGMEALPRIREIDAEVPVVVFTAHGNAENATEAMKLGATDFAEKPFTPQQIRGLVRGLDAAAAMESAGQTGDGTAEATPTAPPETSSHAHRTLVAVEEAASAEALLTLAAATAHSYAHGEVVAVRFGEEGDRLRTEELGATVRTRAAEGTSLRDALPALVEEEAPDHLLLGWSGPPAEARALDTLAQDLAGEFGCEVTLARPGRSLKDGPSGSAHQRIAALVSRAPYALVAVRRALELARSAGVASLTLLSAQRVPAQGDEDRLQRDGRTLIGQVARQAGLSDNQYRAHVTVATDGRALERAAEDFDTLCVSAAHTDELVPALFGEGTRIGGTVVLVRGPEHQEPTILESLVNRLTGA